LASFVAVNSAAAEEMETAPFREEKGQQGPATETACRHTFEMPVSDLTLFPADTATLSMRDTTFP
jgi:hypothetical protein